MSVFGVKADLIQGVSECPLIAATSTARSGHAGTSTNVPQRTIGRLIMELGVKVSAPGQLHKNRGGTQRFNPLFTYEGLK